MSEFNSAAIGAEWLVPLGNFVEAGAGVGFSRQRIVVAPFNSGKVKLLPRP